MMLKIQFIQKECDGKLYILINFLQWENDEICNDEMTFEEYLR